MQIKKSTKRKIKYDESPPPIIGNQHTLEPNAKFIKQDFYDTFNKFYMNICSDKEILKRKSLKKLRIFLQENQHNPDFRAQIGPLCDLKFISGLLCRYNCTLCGEDLIIYGILEHLEKHLCLDFRIMSPLVFGEQSKTYYGEMIKYGRSLHKFLNPDKVLDYFDQKRMWDTLVKMANFNRFLKNHNIEQADPNCYDPRFVLRTLAQLVKPGTKLNCRSMVTSNALSFCFASTSFYDPNLRIFAYAFLERFRRRLLELSEEQFPQRVIYRHMLDLFKDSIEHLNQRTTHVIGQFMARLCKIGLSPEEPLYAPLMAFLTQKPFLQLDTVPEFYKLFFSGSTEFCLKERQWMLRVISNAIVDSNDYGALCRVFALESFMALFCSPLADYWSKLLLLKIFHSCVELKSAPRDMFLRLDFATWLANSITHKRTTVMEQLELATIFKRMVEQVGEICSDQEYAGKLANLELRRPFMRAKLRLAGQKILEHLNRDLRIVADKDVERRDKLAKWLHSEFQ